MSTWLNKLFSITQQSWVLFQRMFARSVALAALTAIALTLADHLVDSGITNRFALVNRFPEFIPWIIAAATLTFIEMSVFWIRFAVQPVRFDIHKAVETVMAEPDSHPGLIVWLYAVQTLVWAFRMTVLIYLAH